MKALANAGQRKEQKSTEGPENVHRKMRSRQLKTTKAGAKQNRNPHLRQQNQSHEPRQATELGGRTGGADRLAALDRSDLKTEDTQHEEKVGGNTRGSTRQP